MEEGLVGECAMRGGLTYKMRRGRRGGDLQKETAIRMYMVVTVSALNRPIPVLSDYAGLRLIVRNLVVHNLLVKMSLV